MSMYSSSLGSEKVGCIAIVSNKYLIHHYFFKKTNNMSMHHYNIAVLKMDIEHVCFKFISSVNPKHITETGNSTIISTINNIYIFMSRRVWRYQRGKRKFVYQSTENTMAKRRKGKRTNMFSIHLNILISTAIW